MNIDDVGRHIQEPGTSEQHINAQAGPSAQREIPVVFLPPPGPTRRRPLLTSSQDLLSRFQLLSAYDKYVRPNVHAGSTAEDSPSKDTPGDSVMASGPQVLTPGALDKGKGREISVGTPRTPFPVATPAADGGDGEDGDEDGGKGEKKKKNGYRHLIKGIPGKHSTKKDDHLQMLMLAPPKQHINMQKFDLRTQREAFSVSLEGLKGWNINALVAESAQAREDRKKRKELKKLAKQGGTGAPALTQLTTSFLPQSAGLSSAASAPTPTVVRQPQTPSSMGVGTPRPAPPNGQRSGSRPPAGPGSARPATPGGLQLPGSAEALAKRGKKREYEEDGPPPPPVTAGAVLMTNGNGLPRRPGGPPPPASTGSIPTKSSMARPMKKPRTDVGTHGHMGLPHPHQQPTPQGV